MKNLKVSAKLLISFLIVVLLAVATGSIGMIGMNKINAADDDLYRCNVVALSALGNIRETLQNQRVILRDSCFSAGDGARLSEYRDVISRLEYEMDSHFSDYEGASADTAAEYAYFEAKNLYLNQFAEIKQTVLSAVYADPETAYKVLSDPSNNEISEKIVDGLKRSMEYNDGLARGTVTGNSSLYLTMFIAEIAVLALTVIISVFFSLYISGIIAKPLSLLSSFMQKAGATGDITLSPDEEQNMETYSRYRDEIGQTIKGAVLYIRHMSSVTEKLRSIADGDLTVDIDVLSDADIMGKSMEAMTQNLNRMFMEIISSTNQVSLGSKQVADGAQSLAQGSTEQAASIQELSGSIAEIAERTKTNAATADETYKMSDIIMGNAEKGSRQMDEMITAVGEINEASKNIGRIIKTIDDIAFQTNILALNAAVEAARAGQHGKGFAVVAEEVRNLASKSAEAAKNTGDMIQNSMEKAELGSRIAAETAASLTDIVNGVKVSGLHVADIAKASDEQAIGISQINTGIYQVAQVIQQNSATAEESAAASEEMNGQSEILKQLVSRFKLKDNKPKNGGTVFQSAARQNFDIQSGKRIALPEKAAVVYKNGDGDFGKY